MPTSRPIISLLLFWLVLCAPLVEADGNSSSTSANPSTCQVCATTGHCSAASPTGTSGKYCGSFLHRTTLTPQLCCCGTGQVCPIPGQDTLCACGSPPPAPPELVDSDKINSAFIVAAVISPATAFVFYAIWLFVVSKCSIPRCRKRLLRKWRLARIAARNKRQASTA